MLVFQATEQEIPIVVRSCIRVINLYGKYHKNQNHDMSVVLYTILWLKTIRKTTKET